MDYADKRKYLFNRVELSVLKQILIKYKIKNIKYQNHTVNTVHCDN